MSFEQPTCTELARDMLHRMMGDISEDYWCAEWMRDLEFTLWDALEDGPRKLGFGTLGKSQLARLKHLHELAGGWWTFSNGSESEIFVSTEQWMEILANHRSGAESVQS